VPTLLHQRFSITDNFRARGLSGVLWRSGQADFSMDPLMLYWEEKIKKEEVMSKKIAVLVRDRQEEALRMAVGIILLDDLIDVYVLDKEVERSGSNELYLETIVDMEMKAFTNVKGNEGMAYLTAEALALRLVDYDHVLPY
jgi:hypothetical protein